MIERLIKICFNETGWAYYPKSTDILTGDVLVTELR